MPNYGGIFATAGGPANGVSTSAFNLPGQDYGFGGQQPWVSPQPGHMFDMKSGTFKPTKTVTTRGGMSSVVPWDAVEQPDGSWRIPTAAETAARAQGASGASIPGVQVHSNRTINPNDPNQRYQAVNIVKSPEIADATQRLTQTFNDTASSALKDFNQYLGEFKNQVGQAATRTATATDVAPVSAALRGQQVRYSDALDQGLQDYAGLNEDTAARERAIVAEARGLIPEYDTSINNLRDYQVGQLQRNVNARYSAGPTSRSMGSGLARELLRGQADISVPLEQARIQQRYNVLSQYALPVEQDIANRETQRIGTLNPTIAAQQFQSGQATEQTIQQLAMVAAQMSYDSALKYMQALSVPIDIQQRILTGQIGNLTGLNNLYSGSRYQSLQDVLGANVTPAVGYSMGTGGYPAAARYSGPSYGNEGLTAMDAPTRVSAPSYPGSALEYAPGRGAAALAPGGGGMVWNAGAQRWQNGRTGDVIPWSRGQAAAPVTVSPQYGTQYGPTGDYGYNEFS